MQSVPCEDAIVLAFEVEQVADPVPYLRLFACYVHSVA